MIRLYKSSVSGVVAILSLIVKVITLIIPLIKETSNEKEQKKTQPNKG